MGGHVVSPHSVGPWWAGFLLAALGLLALCLRIVFPQDSPDKLAWWRDRRLTSRPGRAVPADGHKRVDAHKQAGRHRPTDAYEQAEGHQQAAGHEQAPGRRSCRGPVEKVSSCARGRS